MTDTMNFAELLGAANESKTGRVPGLAGGRAGSIAAAGSGSGVGTGGRAQGDSGRRGSGTRSAPADGRDNGGEGKLLD